MFRKGVIVKAVNNDQKKMLLYDYKRESLNKLWTLRRPFSFSKN